MARKKHDWNDKENYFLIHNRALKKYQWRFLNSVSYVHTVFTDQHEELEIRNALVKTDSGSVVEIKIHKVLEIDISWAKKKVRTFEYSYQAKRPSPDGRIYIRYDSPHTDHNQYHHKHIFDKNGNETEILKISDDEWPHVTEFLDEVISRF